MNIFFLTPLSKIARQFYFAKGKILNGVMIFIVATLLKNQSCPLPTNQKNGSVPEPTVFCRAKKPTAVAGRFANAGARAEQNFQPLVSFMLSKKQRVSRKLFESAYRTSWTFSSPFFVLKAAPAQSSKFAFSVSAKVCPKAVDRNKLRRRGYAAARNLLPQIKTPAIYLFITKKGAEKLNFQKFQEAIKNILQKAGVV